MRTEIQKPNHSENAEMEKMENRRTVSPAVDIFENEKEILMVVDLPGVAEKNVEVHFEKQSLRISGKVDPVPDNWRRTMREYTPTDFERSFKLPNGLEVGKFQAEYGNGVLTLHLPKSSEHQPHRVKITSKK